MGAIVRFMPARHHVVMIFDPFDDPLEREILAEIAALAPEMPDDARTGSSKAAQDRREAARRKRLERKRRADKGVPDPRAVDHAIAIALATVLARGRVVDRIANGAKLSDLRVSVENVVGEARLALEAKGISRIEANRAIQGRLLTA